MKKKVEKTELPKWKQDLFDSIIDAVDRLTDEIGFISEDEHKKYIEKAFNDFEKEIKDEIDLIVLDAYELMKDKDFCSEAIYSIPLKDYSGTGCLDNIISVAEINGYQVIECKSLAELMRFEAFKEELEVNPYQLKLIA